MSNVKEGNSERNSATVLTPQKVFKPKFPSLWIFGRAQSDRDQLNCDSIFQTSENQVLKNGGDEVKASPGSGLNFGIHDSTDYGALVKGDSPPLYYGVSLPSGSACTDDSEEPLVFNDKKEALSVVKKYKGARFKVFQNEEDAVAFASLPADEICPTPTQKFMLPAEISEHEKIQDALVLKPDPFRGPKSQEMVKLRKAIESGDKDYFLETVWSNPRYLISSCDTPAIMQEGFRYNGLHVAAKHKQPEMCRLILQTVEDPAFIELLYSEDTERSRCDRQRYVLDLYLNTPDRGLCETPLHFASKFGCLEAVEILAFHSCCDKKRKNKYGLEAREIICERCPSASSEFKKKIEAIFEEHLFVPVYRSEDNSVQPVIGEPYSVNDPRIPYAHSPVISPESPLDASLSVVAIAGPLSPEDASDLYQQWKTPSSAVLPQEASAMSRIRLGDPEKGLERIGRYLAQSLNASWIEYWPSLEDWCDLSCESGMQKLEDHLKHLYDSLSRKFPLGHEQGQRGEKLSLMNCDSLPNGDSNGSPVLLKSIDANNVSSSSSGSSGMSSLCHRFEDLQLSDNDDSLLKTSPDMPRVFMSHGDPFNQYESPLNSPHDESFTEEDPLQALSPDNCLRDDNRHLHDYYLNTEKENSKIKFRSFRNYSKGDSLRRRLDYDELNFADEQCVSPEGKYALFKNKCSTPKTGDCVGNQHSEDDGLPDSVVSPSVVILVKNMVQVFSELLMNPEIIVRPQTALHKFLTEDVLPHVKCLCESALGSSCEKETVHCGIAVRVCKQMRNLFMVHETRLIVQYLAAYLESKFSDMSSDDELDNTRRRVFMEPEHLTISSKAVWRHLICILVFLNTFLSSSECGSDLSLIACRCVWQDNGNLLQAKVNERVEMKRQNSSGSDLSSDDDYVTPPSSPKNSSCCSTPDEPSTPDEGLEIYVEGTLPSKADADILRVVENVPVDPSRFPHVYRWKHLLSSYDKKVIEGWPSPSRRKFHEDVVCVKSRTPYRAFAMSPPDEISDLSQCFTPVSSKRKIRPSFRQTLNTRSSYERFLALGEEK